MRVSPRWSTASEWRLPGSAPGRNDYWHTGKDTIDKLSAESLQITGRVLIRTLNKLRDVEPEIISKKPAARRQ